MISHPGPELALKRTGGDRFAARHLVKAHIMAEAERLAASAGRSFKCGFESHTGEPDGCANDGSTCLCYCHDQKTGAGDSRHWSDGTPIDDAEMEAQSHD